MCATPRLARERSAKRLQQFTALFKRPAILVYFNTMAHRYPFKTARGEKRVCSAKELISYLEGLCESPAVLPPDYRTSGITHFHRFLQVYNKKTRRARERERFGVDLPFLETWDEGVSPPNTWDTWMSELASLQRSLLPPPSRRNVNNDDDDTTESSEDEEEAREQESEEEEREEDGEETPHDITHLQARKRHRLTPSDNKSAPDVSVPPSAVRFNPTLPLTLEGTDENSDNSGAVRGGPPPPPPGLPKDAIIAELRSQMAESRRDLCEQAMTITRLELEKKDLTARIAQLEREKHSSLKNSREYATMVACNQHFQRFLAAYNKEILAYNPSTPVSNMIPPQDAPSQSSTPSPQPRAPKQQQRQQQRHNDQHQHHNNPSPLVYPRPSSPSGIDSLPVMNPHLVREFQKTAAVPSPTNMTLDSGYDQRNDSITKLYAEPPKQASNALPSTTRFDVILDSANDFMKENFSDYNFLEASQ